MTYDLVLGDYAYSSWSLRGWLLSEKFGIPTKRHLVDFNGPGVAEQLAQFAPAKTVPTLRTPEGAIISESSAIAEELATRFPDAGIWPIDPKLRATARSLAGEMHASFGPLRTHCPMNLRSAYSDCAPPDDVISDLRRLEKIWDQALEMSGGPWLCGDYSGADAFYAPVAARIAGYGLEVSASAQAYVELHLNDLAFRRWRAMGLVRGDTLEWYKRDYPQVPWPGPEVMAASAVETGPSVNDTCPYSGLPVTHFLELGGTVYGFCNAFCRDKTVADPEAWPAFIELVDDQG
jgi:glutathione S-transferase